MGRPEVTLLDTHALIWMDGDSATLGKTSRRLIQQAWETRQLAVCAISFRECAMLQQRGRIEYSLPPEVWRMELMVSGLIEYPVDGETAILATQLAGLHGNPADRFIAATAIRHEATLLTADAALLRWKHQLKRQDATK